MQAIQLSKRADRFVPRDRWIASLSNGETIYEDIRPGEPPAWERLGLYCIENDISITNLRMEVKGTIIKMPSQADGYIQKKVAWTTITEAGRKLCIGYVQGGVCLIQEVCSTGDSRVIRPGHPDYKGVPPFPWTIMKRELRHAIAK